MKRLILIILTGCSVLLGLGPAQALADGTVTGSGVTATLTSDQQLFQQTLSISAPNAPPFSVTLPCVGAPCGGTIQVKRLTPGPRPDVILQSFAEGGGGEIIIDDFSWSVPQDTWVDSEGFYPLYEAQEPSLEALGGSYFGFVTHAALPGLTFGTPGTGPIVIQQPIAGQLVTVTRRFPVVLAADAAQWWAAYQAAPSNDNVEPLAAWAGDERLLGRGAQAAAYIQSQDGLLFEYGQPVSAATFLQDLAADGYRLR